MRIKRLSLVGKKIFLNDHYQHKKKKKSTVRRQAGGDQKINRQKR